MPKITIKCKVPGCTYLRSQDIGKEVVKESFSKAGAVEFGKPETIEERLHHMNSFAEHNYTHGEFLITIDGKPVGLLEVTRDLEARPYFIRLENANNSC